MHVLDAHILRPYREGQLRVHAVVALQLAHATNAAHTNPGEPVVRKPRSRTPFKIPADESGKDARVAMHLRRHFNPSGINAAAAPMHVLDAQAPNGVEAAL